MTTGDLSRRDALRAAAVLGGGAALVACGADAAQPVSTALGSTGDVPVGGGRIYKEQKVVVTQPASGTFRAFTAVCTHQGCLVSAVKEATIQCKCHNSSFSIADGSVLGGPAAAPLAARTVTADGGTLTLG